MTHLTTTIIRQHKAPEERELLPLAEKVLTDADWNELDAAFRTNRDPLTGEPPDAQYQSLFTRIVNALPAPIGLGPASPEPKGAFAAFLGKLP